MNSNQVKFNAQDRPEFFRTLRGRVNEYFDKNGITKYANVNMKFKTAFMLAIYFIPFFVLLAGLPTAPWVVLSMWVLMGFGMSGIGMSVMHDANHGAYSQNKTVNKVLGFLLNFIGGYHENWKIQHNVLHHTYTNVEGYDQDIQNNLMRFSPSRPMRKAYRYQAFYAPFLYSLMTVYWLFGKDYKQVVDYDKRNMLEAQGLTLKKAVRELLIHKSWYLVITLVIPVFMTQVSWGYILLGFFIMHWICGLLLALIFQPAHVISETSFVNSEKEKQIQSSWAIHQLQTTSNFAHGSRFFSWFVGGLNYQIEHHLFPNICHIHYRAIAPIVKQTAAEYNIPYYEHKTFGGALLSHFKVLHAFGTGEYNKEKGV